MDEVGTYRKIQATGLDEALHISRLLGLVRDENGKSLCVALIINRL